MAVRAAIYRKKSDPLKGKDIDYKDLYVIANLPYYITTPIIEKMISSPLNVKAMVLMVQNEVADRLSAKTGSKDYGAITVFLNYYYNINY